MELLGNREGFAERNCTLRPPWARAESPSKVIPGAEKNGVLIRISLP